MHQEIELRFHVPLDAVRALQQDLRLTTAPMRLQARYFDSADRRLARAGIGLRLRNEGGDWVQTVKGPSDDGMSRGEHNVRLGGETLRPDPRLHAPHALGAALLRCLDGAPLQMRFATDIARHSRRLRLRDGTHLELALDLGRLLAGPAEQPVHELELELLDGEAGALLAHAHALVRRWPLSLDVRSKAERGERLARGETMRAPQPLGNLAAGRDARALAAALQTLALVIAGNASQIVAGPSLPAHGDALQRALRALAERAADAQGASAPLDALRLGPRAARLAFGPPAQVARSPALQRLVLEVMGAARALPRLRQPRA